MPIYKPTPWLQASIDGDLEKIKKLYEAQPTLLSSADPGGSNALHKAAWKNNPHIISWLLEKGLNVDTPNRQGKTPLFLSVWESSLESCQILIGAGANPNLYDKDFVTCWTLTTLPEDSASTNEDQLLEILLTLEKTQHDFSNRWKALSISPPSPDHPIQEVGFASYFIWNTRPKLMHHFFSSMPQETLDWCKSPRGYSWRWLTDECLKSPASYPSRIQIALNAGIPVRDDDISQSPFQEIVQSQPKDWKFFANVLLKKGFSPHKVINGESAVSFTATRHGPLFRHLVSQPDFSWPKLGWGDRYPGGYNPVTWLHLLRNNHPLCLQALQSGLDHDACDGYHEGLIAIIADKIPKEYPFDEASLEYEITLLSAHPTILQAAWTAAPPSWKAKAIPHCHAHLADWYGDKKNNWSDDLFKDNVTEDFELLIRQSTVAAFFRIWEEDKSLWDSLDLSILPISIGFVSSLLSHIDSLKPSTDAINILDDMSSKGVHLFARQPYGETVLNDVLDEGLDFNPFMLETILARDPQSLFQLCRNGQNCLHKAAKESQLEAYLFLKKAGARETKDNEGHLPFELFPTAVREIFDSQRTQSLLSQSLLKSNKPKVGRSRI